MPGAYREPLCVSVRLCTRLLCVHCAVCTLWLFNTHDLSWLALRPAAACGDPGTGDSFVLDDVNADLPAPAFRWPAHSSWRVVVEADQHVQAMLAEGHSDSIASSVVDDHIRMLLHMHSAVSAASMASVSDVTATRLDDFGEPSTTQAGTVRCTVVSASSDARPVSASVARALQRLCR